MVKNPHVIWVCPSNRTFFRAKGEVRCRPGSVVPRLSEKGIRLNILIPYDPTLLPKTKLAAGRVTRHTIYLSQPYTIEIIKLTRGTASPGIYMVQTPSLEPALRSAVFSKTAIALAKQLKKPVDIFHIFDWESSLLPLFLEMEKSGSQFIRQSKTFLNVRSLKEQGNFSPATLSYLGIPNKLFHPEGIEFFGKVSFLKSGLLFADSVGIVDSGTVHTNGSHHNGTGLEGVLDSLTHKLRRWASERSLRSYLEAYQELLAIPKGKPLLPMLMQKLHTTDKAVDAFIQNWGPVPLDHYGQNSLSFLVQSPQKAYAFWEWIGSRHKEFGLVLEDRNHGHRRVLSRGLPSLGDYWIEVIPDRHYLVEFVGWTESGVMEVLMRSRLVRTPRVKPSDNRDAVFIDVRNRRRFPATSLESWEQLMASRRGTSSAWDWFVSSLPGSLRKDRPS